MGGDKKTKKKKPSWLDMLLETQFFGACSKHHGIKKRIERNIYCIDCNKSICSLCVSSLCFQHRYHRLLQIRRYIYQNVVRIRDIQNLIDCSRVQPYIVNGAKVVLLNPRVQSKPSKSSVAAASFCKCCRRTVAENSGYCSIFCKVSKAIAQPSEPIAAAVSEGGSASSGLDDMEISPQKRTFSRCSLQPSNWRTDDPSRWIEGGVPYSRRPKVVRRKGVPRRSPIT